MSASIKTYTCRISGFRVIRLPKGIAGQLPVKDPMMFGPRARDILARTEFIHNGTIDIDSLKSPPERLWVIPGNIVPSRVIERIDGDGFLYRVAAAYLQDHCVQIYGNNVNLALQAIKALEDGEITGFNTIAKKLKNAKTPLSLAGTLFRSKLISLDNLGRISLGLTFIGGGGIPYKSAFVFPFALGLCGLYYSGGRDFGRPDLSSLDTNLLIPAKEGPYYDSNIEVFASIPPPKPQ